MDRQHIAKEHVVDRYLSGDLTVREAREFEKYCLEHPEILQELPIPVRLKARLARQPLEESEPGAMHATVEAEADAADGENEIRPHVYRGGPPRWVVMVLVFALIGAIAGLVIYGRQASDLREELKTMRSDARSTQMQAPSSVQTYRLQLSRQRPSGPTLAIGWPIPPQLLDLRIDVTESKYSTYQVTIDKVDGGQVMQIRRLARDSNRELRLLLNSSAFGPGEYLMRFDGYTWRGEPREAGWISLGLK